MHQNVVSKKVCNEIRLVKNMHQNDVSKKSTGQNKVGKRSIGQREDEKLGQLLIEIVVF